MNPKILVSSAPVLLVNDENSLTIFKSAVKNGVRFALDTETHDELTFFNGLWAAVRVISVAIEDKEGSLSSFVLDMRDLQTSEVKEILATMENVDGWNVNFDEQVLKLAGLNVGSWRDAMHTDSVLHSGISGFEFYHGLAHASIKYLGFEIEGKGSTQTSYDASTDLSDEQVRYSAYDALVTILVAKHLDQLVQDAGLAIPVALEHSARPFILTMMEHGLPFDFEGWQRDVLSKHKEGLETALNTLAALTDGNEENLFGESNGPSWNPDSDAPTRTALNTFAKEAVHKFTGGKDLSKSDKLDKTTLKQINHPLAKALLSYRDHAKVLSTYGDNLEEHIQPDKRIHPQYRQGGTVATGRLSSDKPNAQNFAPTMKPYFRPPNRVDENGEVIQRAFVYADLSQAELRVLAQVSNEERMRELFRLGGDFHARTASDMFHVDMDGIKDSDPEGYSNNRKKAKGVNFGIPYGLGAAALATNLTVNSKLLTSTDEAQAMLKAYNKAYPHVSSWLDARDKYVKGLASDLGSVDWDLTLELHQLWLDAESIRRKFKRDNKRNPSSRELSELVTIENDIVTNITSTLGRTPTSEEIESAKLEMEKKYRWAFTYDRPIAVKSDGTAWSFESRTLTGRRRMFTIPIDSAAKDKFEGILTSCALIISTSDKEKISQLRDEFALTHNLNLPIGVNRNPASKEKNWAKNSEFRKKERMSVIKEFEGTNKKLKYALVKFFIEKMGKDTVYTHLLPMAMGDQIRQKGNQFRNHPIQSLVADVGLEYYTTLNEILKKYNNAFPVQAVHDSIAIECDLKQAQDLVKEVKQALELALAHWCPDVPAKADADIRLSLADSDVVSDKEISELLK